MANKKKELEPCVMEVRNLRYSEAVQPLGNVLGRYRIGVKLESQVGNYHPDEEAKRNNEHTYY